MEENQPSTSSAIKNNQENDCKVTWTHPSHIFQRLIALFLMCLIGFGSYFCFDNPGALQDDFIQDMNLTTSQFVYLYSWYSWPNVIMCFVGGFLIDSVFGIRLGTIIYALLVVLGQIVFAAGAYLNALWVMILGRLIFGIGGESLAVAQNNYAVLWFKGKELNMVFGFQISFARVGSTVNFIVMEPLYRYVKKQISVPNYQSLSIVLLVASLTCILSLVSALLLAWQDKRAEKLLHRKALETTEVVRMSDVWYFPKVFWLVTFIIVFYYTSIFPFVALGKVFFEKKYNFSPDSANLINGIIYIISSICAPALGLVIDKTGRNLFWVFLSILGTLVSHMFLAFTFVNPYIAMFTMGLSYSMLASALWPLIAMVIPEHQMGTAYGIAQSVENLGLAVVALLSGIIVDSDGYYMVELFFCLLLSTALLLTAILWTCDSRNKGILNMSINQRNKIELNKPPCPEKQNLLHNNDTFNED
ncbi:major facilitator superfamily domain-containing protein 1-like [Melanaphis sacchari]|uniref:Lysosomal dipeptide transporter MFSD1 n=1 Tax=Melanaphis sacchari TaxID=742174 RepID=A0A2H8TNX8_9HEMI|nr:major facilitator superfamily domain-containing protein 1-like [Melanaphis sacchari]XP_025191929.1 major facilitator superfamily domain-containing protein 1-like [Melanaphis sacchari]